MGQNQSVFCPVDGKITDPTTVTIEDNPAYNNGHGCPFQLQNYVTNKVYEDKLHNEVINVS